MQQTGSALQAKGAAVGLGAVSAPAAALADEAAEFQNEDLSSTRKKELRFRKLQIPRPAEELLKPCAGRGRPPAGAESER